MLAELKTAKEIAVDLEHHDTRSYVGIVSLMQISTREKDWIVDTLKPWRHKLQILNEVFADPNILKVFHGSYMDIMWLQRDFGLYVVNLFDTFHASEALSLQKHSLKYLLEKYCSLNVSKMYQTADWRVRPIPQAMLDYARSDTHYLLYIYDCMRNELIDASTPEGSLIDYVHEESKKYALQTFKRPIYDAETGKGPGGWDNALLKSATYLSKDQLFVFKAVHQWRDKVARLQDDGIHHVMSNALLFQIAQAMPLDQVSLNKQCRPITPTVRSRITELLSIIKQAKTAAATAVVLQSAVHEDNGPPPLQQSQPALDRTPVSAKSNSQGQSLRATTSQFWGNAFPIPTLPDTDIAGTEGFDLAYPMPALASTLSEDTFEANTSNHAPTAAQVPTDPSPETPTPTNDIFTLKQLGGSRKRKADTLQEQETSIHDNDNDSIIPLAPLDETDQAGKLSKAERKAQKKAQKALEREQQNGSSPTAAPQSIDDIIPFDYENAESVLHAKSDVTERFKGKGNRRGKGDGKGKGKEFNPYAKVLDAPSGARRLQTETPGKSFTYKS
jgi:exosome complex exonuclease RRP6